MSLLAAHAFTHMKVTDSKPSSLGLYDVPSGLGGYNNDYGLSVDDTLGASCTTRTFVWHQNYPLPGMKTKPYSQSKKLIVGMRIVGGGMSSSDGTLPFWIVWGGQTIQPISMGSLYNLNFRDAGAEAMLELVMDRETGTWSLYLDGIKLYNNVAFNASIANMMRNESVQDLYVQVARKSHGHNTPQGVKQVYVVEDDGVYPSNRLGSVRIRHVPVLVGAVTGVNKTAAEAEAILNQNLVSTTINGQFARPNGAVRTTSDGSEIEFSLDLSSSPVGNQVAVGVFCGMAKASGGSKYVSLKSEFEGEVVRQAGPDVTVATTADRLKFIAPRSVKADPLDTANLANINYKLQIGALVD